MREHVSVALAAADRQPPPTEVVNPRETPYHTMDTNSLYPPSATLHPPSPKSYIYITKGGVASLSPCIIHEGRGSYFVIGR